jgi:hypothetical protein
LKGIYLLSVANVNTKINEYENWAYFFYFVSSSFPISIYNNACYI